MLLYSAVAGPGDEITSLPVATSPKQETEEDIKKLAQTKWETDLMLQKIFLITLDKGIVQFILVFWPGLSIARYRGRLMSLGFGTALKLATKKV
jgi:hypothetical protein